MCSRCPGEGAAWGAALGPAEMMSDGCGKRSLTREVKARGRDSLVLVAILAEADLTAAAGSLEEQAGSGQSATLGRSSTQSAATSAHTTQATKATRSLLSLSIANSTASAKCCATTR